MCKNLSLTKTRRGNCLVLPHTGYALGQEWKTGDRRRRRPSCSIPRPRPHRSLQYDIMKIEESSHNELGRSELLLLCRYHLRPTRYSAQINSSLNLNYICRHSECLNICRFHCKPGSSHVIILWRSSPKRYNTLLPAHKTPNSCPYFRQMLTNVRNSFAGRLSSKFAIKRSLISFRRYTTLWSIDVWKSVNIWRRHGLREFLPARRYASAGLCDSDVSVCLSVCLSVRLSHAGIVPSRAKAGSWNVHRLIAPW